MVDLRAGPMAFQMVVYWAVLMAVKRAGWMALKMDDLRAGPMVSRKVGC